MGDLADRLAAMTVSVVSPDNCVRAVLRGGDDVTVRFRPGSYRAYTERALEHQLARLAALTFTGHTRGFRAAVAEFGVQLKHRPQDATSPQERRYLEALRGVTVVGATSRKLVRFKTVGLDSWECRIADGTLASMNETEFLEELDGAVRALLNRYDTEVRELKDECFDLELPSKKSRGRPSR